MSPVQMIQTGIADSAIATQQTTKQTYIADGVSVLKSHWTALEQSSNPLVQLGLAGLSTSSAWIPQPVKAKLAETVQTNQHNFDAVVSRLDEAVADTVKKVSESPRVASLTAATSQVAAQIEAHKGATVAELVRRGEHQSRALAARAVDYVLPTEEQEQSTQGSVGWQDLAGTVMARASVRISSAQSQAQFHVEKWSTERVQPIIHVDLVQYAKQVIDGIGGATHISPVFASFTQLKDTTDQAVQHAQTKIHELQQFVPRQVDLANEILQERRQAFKARVQAARNQATLRFTGLHKRLMVVLEEVPVVQLPGETVGFLADTVAALTPESVSQFSAKIHGTTDPLLRQIRDTLASVADALAIDKALALGGLYFHSQSSQQPEPAIVQQQE